MIRDLCHQTRNPDKLSNNAPSDQLVQHIRKLGVRLPTFEQLADPVGQLSHQLDAVKSADRHQPDARNLFRVHWYNDINTGGWAHTPAYLELPKALTGVDARIVTLLGERFPMIDTHKVMAAHACLVPRLINNEFDPETQRAVWPSTGNYCRGGIAISRILGCRGVAVLPEGMSQERFDWLERWVTEPQDIIRTPGTESNVKEIYDKCAELERDERNVILNQFSEYGNYLVHRKCTGRAFSHVFQHLAKANPDLKLAGYVSATGSAGTLGAGDYLKNTHGAKIVAVEATECPTLLRNGFGEHNIQGIGDKHVPLIHNVMNTDVICGISERSCDAIHLLFNTPAGRQYLADRREVPAATIESLPSLGLSSIANVLGAIKFARHFDLGEDSMVMTVATDNASLYMSQTAAMIADRFRGEFDNVCAGEVFGEHLSALGASELLELTREEKLRVFNLGYYTWVEQQGVTVESFEQRRRQRFWDGLQQSLPEWDEGINAINAAAGIN